jgi:hypothetical protein
MISPEFDFVMAFLLGIGFGFVLEQAGFSSTRKLVGLFYGYDFTVLKVFFTAGVTAMTGVLLFGHFGILNLDAIYVNPTYLWSALVGGLIMGAGFIIGGFCPGTSLCAAAVGRIDAMAFIGGSVIGMLAFTEGYPLIEPLFLAGDMGSPLFGEMIGLSAPAFGFALAVIALFAFVATSWIQAKVRGEAMVFWSANGPMYVAAALIPLALIVFVWTTPDRDERLLSRVDASIGAANPLIKPMGSDQLAYELMHNAHLYTVVHVVDSSDVADSTLAEVPSETRISYQDLITPTYRDVMVQRYKTTLFVSDDAILAEKAALLAMELGSPRVIRLTDTVSEFRRIIFSDEALPEDADKAVITRLRFHREAAQTLSRMEIKLKSMRTPIARAPVKAKGGC